jgi:CheY-like chemotaxis protein
MEEQSEQRKRGILVVDDEPEFAAALRQALESPTCEVVGASTKSEAQQALKTMNPDLVILGTLMPRGEAFALHQWLREDPKTMDLPIIVMDAPVEKQLVKGWRRDEAALMDAEDYVSKPGIRVQAHRARCDGLASPGDPGEGAKAHTGAHCG